MSEKEEIREEVKDEIKEEETESKKEKREEMPEWAKNLQNKVNQLAEKLESQPNPEPTKDSVVLIPEPVPPKQEEEENLPEPENPEPYQLSRKEKMQKFWNYKWVSLPAMKRGYTWLCMPISAVSMMVFSAESIVRQVWGLVKGGKA